MADPPDTVEERLRCCLICAREAHANGEQALCDECDRVINRIVGLSDAPAG